MDKEVLKDIDLSLKLLVCIKYIETANKEPANAILGAKNRKY